MKGCMKYNMRMHVNMSWPNSKMHTVRSVQFSQNIQRKALSPNPARFFFPCPSSYQQSSIRPSLFTHSTSARSAAWSPRLTRAPASAYPVSQRLRLHHSAITDSLHVFIINSQLQAALTIAPRVLASRRTNRVRDDPKTQQIQGCNACNIYTAAAVYRYCKKQTMSFSAPKGEEDDRRLYCYLYIFTDFQTESEGVRGRNHKRQMHDDTYVHALMSTHSVHTHI